jgi:L-ascorbate metabolism protein UlaG (beta-lactamase superfamily)
MTLTWYGHSCFLLESDEGSAVFDPYAPGSVPGLTLPTLTADAVFCSHQHADHNYAKGVALSGKNPAFKICRLDCFHDDAKGALRGQNRITVIEAENLRVAHFGDLGHMLSDKQLAKLGKIDVLLIPVGGYYTIDAVTAHALAEKIKPRVVIPMHYRGEGFGYDVISLVDDFLKLSNNVRDIDDSSVKLPYQEDGVVLHLLKFVQ